MLRLTLLASIGALSLLLATTAAPAHAAADAGAPKAEKVEGPPDLAWKDMTKEQKMKFMKAVVNPKMKVTFQAFDAREFKKFGCATCHGNDAKAKDYKMPSSHVDPLPDSPEGFQAMLQKKPKLQKWAKFMGEEVTPQMANLLGMPKFDPKAPVEGAFGCVKCHTLKKM